MTNKKATQIILLSGKSVKNIQNHNIYPNNTLYAVNRKSDIEALITRNIDAWVVTSTLDFIELYDEILEFLERNEENRLITKSEAIFASMHLIETIPLPNPNKVILINSISHKVDRLALRQGCVSNTLSRLLAVLMVNKVQDVALFGCDGVSNKNDKNIYFNQNSLPKERLSRNAIYRDMVMFNKYYPHLLREFRRDNIKVINYNKNTFYKSFTIAKSCKIKSQGEKFIIPRSGYSNKDLLSLSVDFCNLNINKYLYKKCKNNIFKKVKKMFKKS